MGRRLALLIATYDYQDTGLRRLTAPAHDAEALAAVLRDPEIAGFEVTTLVNEPHHRVGEAIGDFYRDRRRDDLTLLYFTGHGLKDDDGRLYLAMTNTRRDSLLFTALSAKQIAQVMESCVSRQNVLVLDCCYSGAFPAGRFSKADTAVHALEGLQGRGRCVLTASDATQYSFEGNQLHGQAAQSVFTRFLVEGLRDGGADLDGDGNITLDELYGYVHDRVVDEMPQQRPKKQDNVEGRIVIARNINWTLPTHLRHALSSPIARDRLGALDGLAHLHRIGNDLVRQSVADEIQHLADDDSRMVSTAAAARLHAIHPQAPESPSRSADSPRYAPVEPAPEVQSTPSSTAPTAAPSQEAVRATARPSPQPPAADIPEGRAPEPDPAHQRKYAAVIDPSSIPNFGGQTKSQAVGAAGPVVPDQDLVKQLLDQMELKYVVDDEGDIAAPWEEFRTYFMFRGEDDQQVFSVRTFYDRPHPVPTRPKVLDAIDDWNRRTLWPKVYTHIHEEEDGPTTVRLIGEAQMLIGTGVSLEHFVSSTVSWARAAIEFDKWLVEHLGLE